MSKNFLKQLGVVKVLLLASFVFGLLFFGSYVLTVSAETKNAGPLKIEYSGADPLFSATNIAPGYSETKTLTITNQGAVPHSFAIAVSGTLGNLANVLHLAPQVSGAAVWDEAMANLADGDSHTVINSIVPGEVATVDLLAYLPDNVGNDYQGATTMTFDFIVGDQEPEPEVSILASPSGGGGAAGAGISGIGGEILGESTSPSIFPSPSPSGTVGGEKNGEEDTETKGTSYKFLYWLIPILVILLILFFLWWRRRRRDEDDEYEESEEI